MTGEVWRPIAGYDGFYEVSDLGRVRSIDRVCVSKQLGETVRRLLRGRIRKLGTNEHGYRTVWLNREAVGRGHRVHVLVLEAFVSPRPEGMEALHRDGDPANNTLGNLRWGTHSENVQDALSHGTHVAHPGSRNGRALLTEADIPEIRRRLQTEFPAAIARDYGVNRSTIQQIKRGQNWSHVPADNDNHQPQRAA